MALTALEQLLVELVNRARAAPAAEAARWGVGLNDGVGGTPISAAAKAPLAVVDTLSDAARAHAADMEARDYFDHTSPEGGTPSSRAQAAGWRPEPGTWGSIAENIAARFASGGSLGTAAVILDHHAGLFRSAGHRVNILSENLSEIGVGHATGDFVNGGTAWPAASLVTELFADGGRTYLTGVALDDRDGDAFYDVGEGLGGVTVRVTGAGFSATTTTAAAGGYTLEVPEHATLTVTFSGHGVATRETVTIAGANVKLDGFAGDGPDVPAGPTEGADRLTGTAGADRIFALGGNDRIVGRGGADRLDGGRDDDFLRGGGGADTLVGAKGDDTLWGDAGRDVFVVGAGRDVVHFDPRADRLDLRAFDYDDFSEVAADLHETADGIVLALGIGTSVTLQGLSLADLQRDDVIL